MKKLTTKIISFILTVSMVFSMSIPAFAAETSEMEFNSFISIGQILPDIEINEKTLAQSSDSFVREHDDQIIQLVSNFEKMSISELNEYISNISDASMPSTNTRGILSPIPTTLELKAAWLAAAQIAKLKGYKCAAKAVEHSVLGINYKEDKGAGGLFRDKIVKTSVYKNYLASFKKSGKPKVSDVKEFTKNDNSDLFYALHNATITLNKSRRTYKVHLYDKFDFALDNQYDSIFTSLVNNWAWLCQNTQVLHKEDINVYFTA